MQNFRSLKVWEKSHLLVLDVYKTTTTFPREELYGLTSQTRRAASSIPANIAEGCGRGGKREFLRLFRIAAGSATELEYHLLLANDLGFLKKEAGFNKHSPLHAQVVEVKSMLSSLISKIEEELEEK